MLRGFLDRLTKEELAEKVSVTRFDQERLFSSLLRYLLVQLVNTVWEDCLNHLDDVVGELKD